MDFKMARNIRKYVRYSIVAIKLVGTIIGAAAVVWGMIEFMWLCYYLGIPM